MKTYQVLEPIKHNGKKYMPPCEIELSESDAQLLIECDAVVELDGQAPEAPVTPEAPATPEAPVTPEAGQANGESTASADAIAEQTDKDTNLEQGSGQATETKSKAKK